MLSCGKTKIAGKSTKHPNNPSLLFLNSRPTTDKLTATAQDKLKTATPWAKEGDGFSWGLHHNHKKQKDQQAKQGPKTRAPGSQETAVTLRDNTQGLASCCPHRKQGQHKGKAVKASCKEQGHQEQVFGQRKVDTEAKESKGQDHRLWSILRPQDDHSGHTSFLRKM